MQEFASNGASTITIQANGQLRNLPTNSTIADFLQALNISPKYVVTQLNGKIIPRDHLDQVVLYTGDKLEIITMVGGG